jgi:cation/acetate symporter
VSIFYLIPQMVGAGALIKPLLGFQYETGVYIVGAIVILIVVTAGMVSTTWVQFIKGSLLVAFCTILTVMVLHRGFKVTPGAAKLPSQTVKVVGPKTFVNGLPQTRTEGLQNDLFPIGHVSKLPGGVSETGPLGPIEFLSTFRKSEIVLWAAKPPVAKPDGSVTTVYAPKVVTGADVMMPGASPTFKGVRSPKLTDKLDFISLMLALFCGTASLPHILIRYYTVKDASAARKSTVVGIGSIGFFYVLTLFIGLGAMTSGAMDPTNNNMAAPLLARSFGETLFAIISAIAFTTVLGTVSGLILAASGAVAHDLMTNFLKMEMSEKRQVFSAKIAAIVVGIIAMWLGIQFQHLNVSFLVGWAFNVAASANLPALVMLLFWKRTTKQGITAAITVGLLTSLTWLLLSAPAYKDVYHLDPLKAPAPFSQPGLVTIPLGFAVLIIVSLLTSKREERSTLALQVAAG